MNIERLTELAEWLEDGAPHVVFDMDDGGTEIGEALIVGPEEDAQKIRVERDAKGLGDCGSVCCIAGYAVHQFKSAQYLIQMEGNWGEIGLTAMDLLDLPSETTMNDRYMYHELFDPYLAPVNCTPQQAAQAVRNVIAGEAPWEGVE